MKALYRLYDAYPLLLRWKRRAGASAPETPTGFTATAGDQLIVLSWTSQPSADTFQIKFGTTNVIGSASVLTSSATGSNFTFDSGESIQAGEKYYFWISATNGAGTSLFSSSVTARSFYTINNSVSTTLQAPAGSWTLSTLFFGATQPVPVGIIANIGGTEYYALGDGNWEDDFSNPSNGVSVSGSFGLANSGGPSTYTFWDTEP
jgi:hypothetical protein